MPRWCLCVEPSGGSKLQSAANGGAGFSPSRAYRRQGRRRFLFVGARFSASLFPVSSDHVRTRFRKGGSLLRSE